MEPDLHPTAPGQEILVEIYRQHEFDDEIDQARENSPWDADPATADLFGERSTRAARRMPPSLLPVIRRKLKWIEWLDLAHQLLDLASPPGNRLEGLKGRRRGQHSIRVNAPYRLTFRREGSHACEVQCEDYHA